MQRRNSAAGVKTLMMEVLARLKPCWICYAYAVAKVTAYKDSRLVDTSSNDPEEIGFGTDLKLGAPTGLQGLKPLVFGEFNGGAEAPTLSEYLGLVRLIRGT